jgi:hypothetical protein
MRVMISLQDLVRRKSIPMPDWFWEGNVQEALAGYLEGKGWSIRSLADTAARSRGIDIVAVRGSTQLLVEVKGYPSTTYKGADEGPTKTHAPHAASSPLDGGSTSFRSASAAQAFRRSSCSRLSSPTPLPEPSGSARPAIKTSGIRHFPRG